MTAADLGLAAPFFENSLSGELKRTVFKDWKTTEPGTAREIQIS
jgi:hypothetical protein